MILLHLLTLETLFSRMKAIIFTLVRAFTFELAVPAEDILSEQTIVQRPLLASDITAGSQMPLLVKSYSI